MASLHDPRREQFAQLIAAGKECTESYKLAGYAGKGASQSAARLNKDAKVSARIAELRELAQQIPVASKWLTENFVLQGLKDVFMQALADKKYSDAIASLNLMGKKLGLWIEKVDHTMHWDGDPSTLNDRQLDVLRSQLERIAYGDDAERIRQERERQLRDSGLLIEGIAEPGDNASNQPDAIDATTLESTATPDKQAFTTPVEIRSWADLSESERKLLAAEWSTRGTALPEGLPKEDRLAWLDLNWPLGPQKDSKTSGT